MGEQSLSHQLLPKSSLETGFECLLTSRHHLAGEAIHIQVSISDRTAWNINASN